MSLEYIEYPLRDGTATDIGRKDFFSLPVLVIYGCVLFNFFLCFINTRVAGLSENHVILVELILISIAAAYGFFKPGRGRYLWLIVLIAQFVLLAGLSILRDELMIKAFRDVMIMPVFIALGLASGKIDFTKPLFFLSFFITSVALFEAASLETFTSYFNIREYYIAKNYDPRFFEWLEEDLFISGIRPGGRFFPFPLDIHRISSVFLEPVSMGFFAFISGLYFLSMKDRLPKSQVLLIIALMLILIWLSDARMAFFSLIMVMVFSPLFERLDHRLTVLIFPVALAFGFFVIESGLFDLGGEGLGARTLWTFERLNETDEKNFFGIRSYSSHMVDSGFLYLLGSQGIFGFLLYWLPPIFSKSKFSKEARIYWFGASLFLAFGFMISSAIFTIKTASLLWFCYGYIIARTHESGSTGSSET
jgi:putative polymerase